MQKCQTFYMESSRRNQHLVKLFTRKLENLSVSDYYGLKSPGLTCYLNSVLQVLFMTEDFREAVKRSCSKHLTPLDQHLKRLFCELERGTAETHNIIEQLGIKDVYEQRDAAEYMEKILCQISSEASKIFKGELNHKTVCRECNKTTDSRSFFWVLPLSVDNSSSKRYSVLQGLEDFFKVQNVSEENQMFCDNCDKKQDTDIKYELTQSPDVLTLLLKRFTFDYRRSCYIKLHRRADMVPTLNLQNCRYELYAVVHHYGYLTGGHYTADIKSFETGNWYCFNDNTVQSAHQQYLDLEKNSLRSKTAYLLMYRKVDEQTRRTDGRVLKAQRGHSDVQTEDRWDASKYRAFLAPDYHLKIDNFRGGDYMHLNGDNVFERTVADSWRREKKQSNQRAELVRRQSGRLFQTDTEAEGQQESKRNLNTDKSSDGHLRTNSSRATFLQDSVVKAQIINETRKKQDDIKTDFSPRRNRIKPEQTKVVSNQTEAAAALTLENSLKRNKMKKQPVVAENNKYLRPKTVRKGENTVSQTERSGKMCENKNTRTPWK